MNSWTSFAGVDDQRQCQNCGAHVSASFRRCYGDDETDTVHACPSCTSYRELFDDAAEVSR